MQTTNKQTNKHEKVDTPSVLHTCSFGHVYPSFFTLLFSPLTAIISNPLVVVPLLLSHRIVVLLCAEEVKKKCGDCLSVCLHASYTYPPHYPICAHLSVPLLLRLYRYSTPPAQRYDSYCTTHPRKRGSGHSNQAADVYFRQLNGIVFFSKSEGHHLSFLLFPLHLPNIVHKGKLRGNAGGTGEKVLPLLLVLLFFSRFSLSPSLLICSDSHFCDEEREDPRIYYTTPFKARKNEESDCLSANRKKRIGKA